MGLLVWYSLNLSPPGHSGGRDEPAMLEFPPLLEGITATTEEEDTVMAKEKTCCVCERIARER